MRVMLTKGRIDHEAEKILEREMPGLRGRKPPYYFFSWIILDLERACRKRGWDVETMLVGNPKQRRHHVPDILINLISEPLVCRRALDRLESVIQERRLRVLNSVAAVRRSSRTELPHVISGIDQVRVPRTTRFIGEIRNLKAHIESNDHRWPILVRPAGTHGSQGLQKFDTPDAISGVECPASGLLVTDFVDFRSDDGLYRKYRMICVGDQIFRRHLIASENWNVTGSARVDMSDKPNLITAEKEFLSAGCDVLDRRVADLFGIVGLDFGVIDFAVLPHGEIVIFELNSTFQISGSIPPEHRESWGYLEGNNGAIREALLDSITRLAKHQ